MPKLKIQRILTNGLDEFKKEIKNFAFNTESLLFFFAKIAENRAGISKDHADNVFQRSILIANELKLSDKEREILKKGAFLRDIGMLGVPESVLKKKGEYSDKERVLIQSHTVIGFEMCKSFSSVEDALPIIRHHHERWDGRGYPDGLSKENIPLLARIIAVVDSFYSLLTSKPYRDALYKREALAVLVGGAGAFWDPTIVRIFFDTLKERDKDIFHTPSVNFF